MTSVGRGVLAVVLLTGCGGQIAACGGGGSDAGRVVESPDAPMTIAVSSPAVVEGGLVPRRFTCDGQEVSLPLAWSGIPSGSVELALLMEDPDAPGRTFAHWVIWGIDPAQATLGEGEVPPGTIQGRNDFNRPGYGGPCPPRGETHRYTASVFALSLPIDVPAGASAADLRRAMPGTVLGWGRLTARYQRG